MKYLLIILALFIVGCEASNTTNKYYDTEYGPVIWSRYYCDFGVLLNTDKLTVIGKDNRPIKCNPAPIELTNIEFETFYQNKRFK